ncbi:maleylacetoacetate isomerase [Shewanella saliphila]|uniref:Maleylacetoacetate isomerase n=1 Tax=Shewanella saliphila TaxID=2282698 RepID=A0ABQ2Q9D0_9GAMM|nr:maleylacetoacetate isomerase [Shewanella saliphila]MCL1102693.1 maleylacetoacetate isomerase [Shewanella saliphila]GGP58804.1 maleylacetoacetate isomerase [Shewanella saliphila]
MKLYGYWRSSAAYRVRITLNLKQLSAEQISVHLVKNGGEQHSQAYDRLNPQHLVPTLVYNGIDVELSLSQSLAIIEYLEEKHPQIALLPSNIEHRAIVRSMAQAIACEIHPLDNLRVLQYLVNDMGVSDDDKMRWYHHWIIVGFTALEAQLSQYSGRYCFGDTPTLADICLVPQVYNAKRFNVPLDDFPNIVRIDQACNQLAPFADAAPELQHDAS